jgi:hypothetical protein
MPLLPLLCTGGNRQTRRIRWTRRGDAPQAAGEAAKVYSPGAAGMTSRLFLLLALVVMIAAAWAALVTLFSPPLTLGWREFSDAMGRRWVRNIAVLDVELP